MTSRGTLYVLLLLLVVCASAKKYERYATLMVCDMRNKKPKYTLKQGDDAMTFEYENCTKMEVKGKTTGKMHYNHAKVWPVDGQTFKGLQSMTEYIFLCDRGDKKGKVTLKRGSKELYSVSGIFSFFA